MTPQMARRVLNAPQGATVETLSRMFRDAVKRYHPDTGGDADRLREAIEAHRVLQSLASARLDVGPSMWPARDAKPRPLRLEITAVEAMLGGERRLRIEGRMLDVRLPAGLRAGETLRLTGAGRHGGDVFLKIGVINGSGYTVRGDDVWLEIKAPLPPGGGRIEVDTPRGKRTVWHKAGSRKLTRLAGEGLPARGLRKAGDLFLKIEADETAPASASPAQEMLRRFTGTWAAA